MPTRSGATDDMSQHSEESSHGHKHNLRNRFEVLKTLGQGTYGKVKLAIDKLTGTEVAIKYIKKTKIQNENDLTRIRREIDIMSNLNHPHIIQVYEVFENKEKIILVLEYASGGELYDYINEKQGLDTDEARICFRQIVSAVYYLHQNGIVHRDLKLENIVLDMYGDVKIADFGLSNVYSKDAMLQTFCGSPLYASPEIINGLPYCGPEVDCWSLGVLLYAIVYGAMPFDGSDFRKLRNQITMGKYYEPENPSECAGLVKNILTVHPANRAGITDICCHWWVNKGFKHTPRDVEKLALLKESDSDDTAQENLDFVTSGSASETEPECETTVQPQPVLTNARKGILKNTVCEQVQESAVSGSSAGEESLLPEVSRHHRARESGIESGASGEELDHDSLEEESDDEHIGDKDHVITEPRDTDIVSTVRCQDNDVVQQVPQTVFDSSRKPVRGILKNKNKQKYQGSDSGCVIVTAPDDGSHGNKTDDAKLQRESSLENSYDLTDIEQVLDDIDVEDSSSTRTSQQFIEQYPSLGKYVQYTDLTGSNADANTSASDCVGESLQSSYHGNTVVKRRKGILKKHSKYSSDYDPTKRYSYGSQGSNSSGDILDFSYDSLDEETPRRRAKELESELSSSIPEGALDFSPDSYLYQEREVKFGADFDANLLHNYCHDHSYRDNDDEIIKKINELGAENFDYNESLVTDDSEVFELEDARLVYEQAIKYCSDSVR